MVKHSVKEELHGVLAFIGVIWSVFLIGLVVPFNIAALGITPRTPSGLVGIVASPFLHSNLGHLLSNTVPLAILLMLLAGSRARSWAIVMEIVLLSGALLWLFGRTATHVGASGLIYGLIAFLIVSGLMERRVVPLAISILVGVLYGGTLLAGVVPELGSRVSWEGHLFGAMAGGVVAYAMTKEAARPSTIA